MWLYVSGNGHKSIEDQTEVMSCPHTTGLHNEMTVGKTPSCNTNRKYIRLLTYIYTTTPQQDGDINMVVIFTSKA